MLARRLSGLLLIAALGFAQQKPDLTGDYAGVLAPLHVKLHLVASHDGTITGTVDSPDQNLYGLQCANFHINGQSLSFDVPMVHGTWIGFVSGDGSTLSGMWNQGSPMPLNLTRVAAAAAGTSNGAASSQAGPGEVKWDDYVFKFNPSGSMAQVYEGGKVVGTILTMNGQQQVLPLPGTDADKLKKSFEDYKAFAARSHSGSSQAGAATAAAPPEPAAPAMAAPPMEPSPTAVAATSSLSPVKEVATPASAIRFDESAHTITVPRPDGVTVTFVGQDVKIAGLYGRGFILRHQKGSVGRFMESNVEHSTRAGGSISGGGVEFLYETGGLIYDSGMGSYNLQENPQIRTAKQLSQVAVAAVADVRQVPGHESFTPPGYNTLKDISQYRLRSDGSR
jgi:hypothetical protein